jgi:hypothetical protein
MDKIVSRFYFRSQLRVKFVRIDNEPVMGSFGNFVNAVMGDNGKGQLAALYGF